MRKLATMLAATMLCALSVPASAATYDESPAAQARASDAATDAMGDMADVFGDTQLKPGKFLWAKDTGGDAPVRVVVSLSDQMAYVYRGDRMIGVSTVSSGRDSNPTPVGVFPIQAKKPMHHSKKYDNAPMPFMQRLDDYGIALHAGHNPGYAASHGCIRLPAAFAKQLYGLTRVGTEVLIAA